MLAPIVTGWAWECLGGLLSGTNFFKNESLRRDGVRTAQAVIPGIVNLIDLLTSEAKICIELGLTGNPFAFTLLGSSLRAW